MADFKENCIEWITGRQRVTVTLSQPKYIGKVKRLAKTHPDEVQIKHINEDGSIVAHLPLKAIKISIVTRSKKDTNLP